MKNRRIWLSPEEFGRVFSRVPRPTVEVIVVRGERSKEFLLGKRARKPYRGRWFVIGGGVLYGESLEMAVRRALVRELGIRGFAPKFLGHLSYVFPPNDFGVRTHSLMHVYLVWVCGETRVTANQEHAALKWFHGVNPAWPLPLKKILAQARFWTRGARE